VIMASLIRPATAAIPRIKTAPFFSQRSPVLARFLVDLPPLLECTRNGQRDMVLAHFGTL
jgi:hypothetical protein